MMEQAAFQLPFDAESLKLIYERPPFELDPMDLSAWRTAPAPRNKLIDFRTRTFGDRFD
jgi:hypothetical protein